MADDEGWTEDLPWIGQYVLDENGNPVPAQSLLSWGRWMEDHRADCQLAMDQIGEARVSTIFLALDFHAPHDAAHIPILWETMVFGGPYNLHQQRYTSKEDARRGHARIVQMLTS